MDYARLFLEQLGLVEQTVRFIGRRHCLSAEELGPILGAEAGGNPPLRPSTS